MKPPTKCEKDRLLTHWGLPQCSCGECCDARRRFESMVLGDYANYWRSARILIEGWRGSNQ